MNEIFPILKKNKIKNIHVHIKTQLEQLRVTDIQTISKR